MKIKLSIIIIFVLIVGCSYTTKRVTLRMSPEGNFSYYTEDIANPKLPRDQVAILKGDCEIKVHSIDGVSEFNGKKIESMFGGFVALCNLAEIHLPPGQHTIDVSYDSSDSASRTWSNYILNVSSDFQSGHTYFIKTNVDKDKNTGNPSNHILNKESNFQFGHPLYIFSASFDKIIWNPSIIDITGSSKYGTLKK